MGLRRLPYLFAGGGLWAAKCATNMFLPCALSVAVNIHCHHHHRRRRRHHHHHEHRRPYHIVIASPPTHLALHIHGQNITIISNNSIINTTISRVVATVDVSEQHFPVQRFCADTSTIYESAKMQVYSTPTTVKRKATCRRTFGRI